MISEARPDWTTRVFRDARRRREFDGTLATLDAEAFRSNGDEFLVYILLRPLVYIKDGTSSDELIESSASHLPCGLQRVNGSEPLFLLPVRVQRRGPTARCWKLDELAYPGSDTHSKYDNESFTKSAPSRLHTSHNPSRRLDHLRRDRPHRHSR